jgi:hypothetical protein
LPETAPEKTIACGLGFIDPTGLSHSDFNQTPPGSPRPAQPIQRRPRHPPAQTEGANLGRTWLSADPCPQNWRVTDLRWQIPPHPSSGWRATPHTRATRGRKQRQRFDWRDPFGQKCPLSSALQPQPSNATVSAAARWLLCSETTPTPDPTSPARAASSIPQLHRQDQPLSNTTPNKNRAWAVRCKRLVIRP